MALKIVNPFPLSSVSAAWEWHARSKALSAVMGRDLWMGWCAELIHSHPSWGIELDGETVGMVAIELLSLPGRSQPNDGQVHIAVARKAWGKEVIQNAAEVIIPAVFEAHPSLPRLSAWTVESNYPARAVAEALGFIMEGKLRDAAPSVNGNESLLVYGLTRAEASHGIGS